ncbi:MAG: protein Tex [Kosmotoga sp.]|nr:protein Tex [Kosmotoga sp.]
MIDFTVEIAKKLGLPTWKVKNSIELLEEGKTIPFIARYRKEKTGELNEVQIREIADMLEYLKKLETRKEEVLRLISEKGKLTPELEKAIKTSESLQEVEDLYLPYKTRKKTKADIAREKGLEPLAEYLLSAKSRDDNFVQSFISEGKGIASIEEALVGAKDIIAEKISHNVEIRGFLRTLFSEKGIVKCSRGDAEDPKGIYRDYYDFSQPIKKIPSHRILAIFRGEREKVLKVTLSLPFDPGPSLQKKLGISSSLAYFSELLEALKDSYERLLKPSIEREVRSELKASAEDRAIKVFAKNLRNLLLQPPMGEKVVMGIDPGYRTGCKIAVVGKDSSVLYHDTIYPTPPRNDKKSAQMKVANAVRLLGVEIIAIGNGTASRETASFVAETIKTCNLNCKFMIVSEAGASVYSASKTATEELPEYDVTTRGAISIARRVQDPLAEYVKIPPESIGVGMYQHDVSRKNLKKALDREVESVVNYVGVNLNTASEHLLKYISGLNARMARNIVEYRKQVGLFKKREDLLKVKGIGNKAFEQAAGFCRIIDGEEPLDNTIVHPESYHIAREVLKEVGILPEEIIRKREELRRKLEEFDIESFVKKAGFNPITVKEVVKALKNPGLDPREELPKPILHDDVLSIEDLRPDMELEGTVRNVVDFGAFVDIGVKQDGLIHKTRMGKNVYDPLEVLSVGQIVKVKVLSIDLERERIALELVEKRF